MAMRFLAFFVLLGHVFNASGCSSLNQQCEWQSGLAETHSLAAQPTHQHLAAKRDASIRLVKFDEPVQNDLANSPDLLPIPQSDDTSDTALEPHTIHQVLNPHIAFKVASAKSTTIDLDLPGALAMVVGRNPRIAFAEARYREAYARLEFAKTLWLPSLRGGMSFNRHDGTLQTSAGDMIDSSRSSLQAGLGVRAVGAGTPAVPGVAAEFHASDAFFQPQIAANAAYARDAATDATTNDTLLATALAYLDLLRTTQQLRIAEETRDNAKNLAELTSSFARTGQGSQADADRAQTELVRRRIETSRSRESTRVASARLAELLSLDPSVDVMPKESTIVPIDLVSDEISAADLVATALSNRPELAEAQYLVCEAVSRYRREMYAPLLPSVLLGVSQGSFGGGSGSIIDNDRRRFDFDAALYWELRNFGLGEQAKRDETRARYDQTRALQVSMMDRVVREVVESHAQMRSRKGQTEVAQSGVKSAIESYESNLVRVREGQGLPIEVLQSLQALDEARREYLRTLADYNETQFRLQRALGWPTQL